MGLMVVAMLGLIVLQWFWLENAHQTRKMQFDWQVNDALQSTIRKLEKQEIVLLATQQIKQNEQLKLKKLARQPKSSTSQPISEMPMWLRPQPQVGLLDSFRTDLSPASDILLFESYGQDFDIQAVYIQELLKQQHFYNEEYARIEAERGEKKAKLKGLSEAVEEQISTKNLATVAPLADVRRQSRRSEVVKNTVEEVIIGKRALYERIDRQMLDTLLKQELKNRGISIPYDYGVKDASSMVFSSFALHYDHLKLDKAYKVALFPNDAVAQNQFLYVLFPNKGEFIFQKMWGLFLMSGLLVLMIGGVFFQASATMFGQKKLADIKNDFINNMTHEFKTPIATISLAAQFLKDNSVQKDSQKLGRYLGIIEDENSRLGKHVEKVLQMALLDKGEVKLSLGQIHLHDVIEKVLENSSVQIEQRSGELNFAFNAEHDLIEADELHVTNILYNLLDNAIKYSPNQLNINLSTRNVDKYVVVSITDAGQGMTKEQVSKIFDKFYRVPTGNQHDVKGFGLGLSYVKKMLEAHQAQITVISKPNEGSTFEISFLNTKA